MQFLIVNTLPDESTKQHVFPLKIQTIYEIQMQYNLMNLPCRETVSVFPLFQ